nr:Methyltransferase domain protein [uncultured bacterium]
MDYKFAPAFISKSFSGLYDPITTLLGAGKRFHQIILNLADIGPNDRVADIGCGTGSFLVLAKSLNRTVKFIGIDPDDKILEVAAHKISKRSLDIQLVKAYAEQLPFPDNSFTKIFSTLAFHHMPFEVKKAAAREIYRTLETGGQFFLNDFGKPKNFFWKIILTLESLIEPTAYIKDNLKGQLPLLLRGAGFSVKELRQPYLGIRFYLATK